VARIFKKWTIGFTTFLAPVDIPVITKMMDEIAAFAAKNPDLLLNLKADRVVQTPFGFKVRKKGVSGITALAVALGPKGDAILRDTGNLAGLGTKKRIGRLASMGRPLMAISPIKVPLVPRAVGLGLNLIKIGPLDIFVSLVLTVFALRAAERRGEFTGEVRIGFEGEELEGRTVSILGKGFFVREQAAGLAFAATEFVDQLLFGVIPDEAVKEPATGVLAAFIEGALQLIDPLVFTGLDPEGTQATGFASPTY